MSLEAACRLTPGQIQDLPLRVQASDKHGLGVFQEPLPGGEPGDAGAGDGDDAGRYVDPRLKALLVVGQVLTAHEARMLTAEERRRFVEFDKAGRVYLPLACQVAGSGVLLPPAQPESESPAVASPGCLGLGQLVCAFNEPGASDTPSWR